MRIIRQLLVMAGCMATCGVSAQSLSQYISNQTTKQPNSNFFISGVGFGASFRTIQATIPGGNVHYGLHHENGLRWGLGMVNVETADDSSNSDFAIFAYKKDNTTMLGQYLTIMRNSGNMGLGVTNPQARLHMETTAAVNGLILAQRGIPETNGVFSIGSASSNSSLYLPLLRGRGYAPGRPFGIYLIGESEDAVSGDEDNKFAAVILDGRTKSNGALSIANVLSVNSNGNPLMTVKANGNVGIGTTSPGTNKLAVEGTIAARRVRVLSSNPWPDYVFHQQYELASIESVAAYIKQHQRLPGMPAAAEVEKEGVDLGEVNRKLVEKVEEMMLYIIKQEKEIKNLKIQNNDILNELKQLKRS